MGIFFLRVQSSSLPPSRDSHGQQNTNFIRKVAESKNWMPGAKMEATLGERTQSPPTQELKQLTGRQGCGGQGCQHFQGLKTLNKQKINIHGFYKLQHYETVGHITQKKNLQYLQSLILRSLEKQWFFFTLIYAYKILQRKVKETQLHTDIWLSWWIKHDFLI